MSESLKRGRGRPRTVDRDQAVQIAMRSWWSEGAEALSINEISRRTGLSKSSLYREFGGEDGLMAAALATYRAKLVVPLLAIFDRPLPPAKTLALVAHATTADHGLPAGCFFTQLRLAPGAVGASTAAAVDEIAQERLGRFEAWFTSISAPGVTAVGLGANEAARYLDAQITLVLVRMASGDPVEDVRADALRAFSALLDPGYRPA